MLKAELLRQQLTTAVRFFRDNPDRLEVFVKSGHAVSGGQASPSFRYDFEINVLAMDFSGSLDELIVPVLGWAKLHQPDLLFSRDQREKGIGFEAEILDNGAADILITVKASELVIVTAGEDGRPLVQHRDQPKHFEDEAFSGWNVLNAVSSDGDVVTPGGDANG